MKVWWGEGVAGMMVICNKFGRWFRFLILLFNFFIFIVAGKIYLFIFLIIFNYIDWTEN